MRNGYQRYGKLSKIVMLTIKCYSWITIFVSRSGTGRDLPSGNRKHYNENKTSLKRMNIIPSSREKTYVLVASTGLEGCVDELASMIFLLVLLPFRSTMLLRESEQASAAHGGCLPA